MGDLGAPDELGIGQGGGFVATCDMGRPLGRLERSEASFTPEYPERAGPAAARAGEAEPTGRHYPSVAAGAGVGYRGRPRGGHGDEGRFPGAESCPL